MRVRLLKYVVTPSGNDLHALIEGEAAFPPVEGRPFRVVADDDRRVTTTDVAMVLPDGWFVTLAGRYHIELLDIEALAILRRAEQV